MRILVAHRVDHARRSGASVKYRIFLAMAGVDPVVTSDHHRTNTCGGRALPLPGGLFPGGSISNQSQKVNPFSSPEI